MLEQYHSGVDVEPPLPATDSSSLSDHFLPPPSSWFTEVVDEAANVINANGNGPSPGPGPVAMTRETGVSEIQVFETEERESDDIEEDDQIADSVGKEQARSPTQAILSESLKSRLIISSPQDVEVDPSPRDPQPRNLSSRSSLTNLTARPEPAPSFLELSSQVLPAAARELLSSSIHRVYHTARVSYASSRWRYRKYSDLNQTTSALGYYKVDVPFLLPDLPPFSSLPWLERQLVQEWRTLRHDDYSVAAKHEGSHQLEAHDDVEADFNLSRTLVPVLVQRPEWQKSDQCSACRRVFGPTRLRHHCRNCGRSFCHSHSAWEHSLPHLGYEIPERVCEICKRRLDEQCLAERVAWRLARCRDYTNGELSPYFEIGVETLEEAALRVTQAALTMARSIPLGAQASVAVETVDVLRKYGLNGIYTVMLRQEFLAAADLLRKALGINRSAWPLSVHELSAAIFYALAQHRALRGSNPELEHLIHGFRNDVSPTTSSPHAVNGREIISEAGSSDDALLYSETECCSPPSSIPFRTVCDPVPDSDISSFVLYAPLGLNFIYVEKPVDMQLLAAQQGWRLLYAFLEQDVASTDRPASALFVNDELMVACIAVRGTSTIQDVVTDIRQIPAPFPDSERTRTEGDWTSVIRCNGVAACGMAGAATTLYREHIDSLVFLAKRGYRVRLTGHSLGGAVATLLGVLVYRDLKRECPDLFAGSFGTEAEAPLHVYAFGSPSCVDEQLADDVNEFVTTIVLHDDCVPRLTPTSCRGLLKHLLHIRETWVKDHLPDDIRAITDRAKTVWEPRWRGSFTLSQSSSRIKKWKRQILLVKEKLVGDECRIRNPCYRSDQILDAIDERMEEYVLDRVESPRMSLMFEPILVPDSSSGELAGSHPSKAETRMFLDYLGGDMESGTGGLVVDGDEFFDPTDSLVEDYEYGCDKSVGEEENIALSRSGMDESESVSARHSTTSGVRSGGQSLKSGAEDPDPADDGAGDEAPGSVVVEEMPLPKMFVPGRIVHVYSHRGVYRAAYVPRRFRELRRITMAGNMLSDHKVR
jgi:hypothetical protein